MSLHRVNVEFRSAAPEDGAVERRLVRGHAAVYNQVTRIGNEYEQVLPGAFDRALKEQQSVVLLFNHEGQPLARTRNGSLVLGSDEQGLTVRASLPDTTLGRDVQTLMDAELLDEMSFGFIVREDSYDKIDGKVVRSIRDVDLFDVSLVSIPAYSGTDAELRTIQTPQATPARGQAALIRARVLVEIHRGR